jgi:hypothetical protein
LDVVIFPPPNSWNLCVRLLHLCTIIIREKRTTFSFQSKHILAAIIHTVLTSVHWYCNKQTNKHKYTYNNGCTSQWVILLFCLPPAFTLFFTQLIFSTLKMEAIRSSKTSVDTQRTTRRYIPEDGNLTFFFLFSIHSRPSHWLHLHELYATSRPPQFITSHQQLQLWHSF